MSSMAGGDGLHDDSLTIGSYSQLLFSDDIDDQLDADGCFNFNSSSFPSENPSKMLCFGDYTQERDLGLEKNAQKIVQKTGVTCSDSSSASSTNNNRNTKASSLPKSNKKPNVSGAGRGEQVQKNQNSGSGNGAPAGSQRKKTKSNASSEIGHAKVKKEKLGERIVALQQLVSPFGKTDTASVLHEAMGYIRFLHDQVQVLCSPYLQRLPSSAHQLHEDGENGEGEGETRKDLRSKGLCLVPIELTLHMADDNGADFWSPAMVNNVSSN